MMARNRGKDLGCREGFRKRRRCEAVTCGVVSQMFPEHKCDWQCGPPLETSWVVASCQAVIFPVCADHDL